MNNQIMNMFGNMQNFISQFDQFKNGFHGDARQQVQNMLNTGKITQEQYNQAVQIANAVQGMIRK